MHFKTSALIAATFALSCQASGQQWSGNWPVDASSCTGWDCDLDGQNCPQGVSGASSDSYCCKTLSDNNKKWIEGACDRTDAIAAAKARQAAQIAKDKAAKDAQIAKAALDAAAKKEALRVAALAKIAAAEAEAKAKAAQAKLDAEYQGGDACGAGKGDFILSLASQGSWDGYRKASKCHSAASKTRKQKRNKAVKAWFKSVTAAKNSKKAYEAALKARDSRRTALSGARKTSALKAGLVATATKILIAAKTAAKEATAAQTKGNAAADARVNAATLARVNSKAKFASAVTKTQQTLTDATSASKKAAKASKKASQAQKEAQSSFDDAQKDLTKATGVNTKAVAARAASKAASIAAHNLYSEGSRTDSSNGYFH